MRPHFWPTFSGVLYQDMYIYIYVYIYTDTYKHFTHTKAHRDTRTRTPQLTTVALSLLGHLKSEALKFMLVKVGLEFRV